MAGKSKGKDGKGSTPGGAVADDDDSLDGKRGGRGRGKKGSAKDLAALSSPPPAPPALLTPSPKGKALGDSAPS